MQLIVSHFSYPTISESICSPGSTQTSDGEKKGADIVMKKNCELCNQDSGLIYLNLKNMFAQEGSNPFVRDVRTICCHDTCFKE